VSWATLLPAVTWLAGQLLLSESRSIPALAWPLTTAAGAIIGVLPAALVGLLTRRPWVRAVSRYWILAGASGAALGLSRITNTSGSTTILFTNSVIALLIAGILYLRESRARASREPGQKAQPKHEPGRRIRNSRIPPLALGAGTALTLPWVWAGALGSPADTAVAVLSAAALGLLFLTLSETSLGQVRQARPPSRTVEILTGGLVLGVALALVATGAGAGGTNLLLLLTLPPTGFLVCALIQWPVRISAILVPVAGATFGPLAYVDPDELTILLGTRDVGWYALLAGSFTTGLALLLGLLLTGLPLLHRRRVRDLAAIGFALASAIAVTGVGVTAQPGFHGERMFVILTDQLDLSAQPAAGDLLTRRAKVYQQLVAHSNRTQAALRRALRDRRLDYTPYYLVNAIEVTAAPWQRHWLESRPEVDRVLDSPQLRPIPAQPPAERGASANPPESPPWNITMISANEVWAEGITGRGIVIGSSDSGVDGRHPALARGFRGGEDSWYDPWYGAKSPRDYNGHGTHTLGSAAGGNGIGVAPGAQWIGCVNLARGLGNPARYLACLQFMLAPFPRGGNAFRDGNPAHAADVLNNSWGCPELEGCDATSLLPAVRAFRAAGIYLVVSAGNSGPRCSSVTDPPALYDEVLSVGAVDRRRALASFSSRGPVTADGSDRAKPDLVAPGAGILSALPGGTYGIRDGTSMAGPQVAGVVALMWSANPALRGNIALTTKLLLHTASPEVSIPQPGKCGRGNELGHGLVNAAAAVTAARQTISEQRPRP
jgi:hypothetical protein